MRLRGRDIVEILIKAGANVNQADGRGWTPLGLACSLGGGSIAMELIKAGADIQVDGTDLLKLAIESNMPTFVKLLLEKGVMMNKSKSDKQDLFSDALRHNAVDVAKMIIEWGVDINQDDKDTIIPLMRLCAEVLIL